MDYNLIYQKIVKRAHNRNDLEKFERHHIIPKSLGGDNSTANIVKLSIREHFVCHKLLVKMCQGVDRKKMWFALYRLSNRHKITSGRLYEQSKLKVRKYLSEIHSGKVISESHRQAIRDKTTGEKNPNFGRKHSKENINLMSKVKIGNTHAKVGINIVDFQNQKHINSVESISELCKMFNLTRGQAEHYIYNQKPYNGLLFVRQKIIKRK
jgi:hypothetical protein